jgi:hypothetical protein
MPLVNRTPEASPPEGGLSPFVGRPLFVPPGISSVRTGPTTRAELDRLLSDVASGEVSGVRLTPIAASAPNWLVRLSTALGFSSSVAR